MAWRGAMTNFRSLVLAVDLATRKRDDAGRVLSLAQQRRDRAQNQMEQLQSYSRDTSSRWSVPAQTLATPVIVGHYYQFMGRLDETMVLQQAVIADLQRQCELAKGQLLEAEVRVAGLTRVFDQRRAVLVKAQAWREQKQTDEFAARQHRRITGGRDNQEVR